MIVSSAQLQERQQLWSRIARIATPIILIAFSIFYFTNVLLRASEKAFWFDEIITVYMCRLPDLHSIWQALTHGIDYNPPFFYVITRVSKTLFGENLIGMRIPQILGFWVFCLCLFRIVSRRAGRVPGLIAMLLPMLTTAFFYAYEARAHGITLGFCGLAAACWQMSFEEARRTRWLIAFSLALVGAFLVHCFALLIVIPFALLQIFHDVRWRRIHWPMWFALAIPAVIAIASYVPLFLAYKAGLGGTSFPDQFPPSIGQITSFYISLLWPCITVIVAAIAVFVIGWVVQPPFNELRQTGNSRAAEPEVMLSAAFLLLPAFGLILNFVVHGPFFARYYLSALLGICVLIGLGVGLFRRLRWVSIIMLLVMGGSLGWQFSALLWHRLHGRGEDLVEPSASLVLNTKPGDPLAIYRALLSKAGDDLPIVVPRGLEFIYLSFYAPQLRDRLYYVGVSDYDISGFRKLRKFCPAEFTPERTIEEFTGSFPHFFVYSDPGFVTEFARIAKAGGVVKSIQVGNGHFLAEIQR